MFATIYGKTLNLSIPADADAFVAAYHDSAEQAEACGHFEEFEYANFTLARDVSDNMNIRIKG